MRRALVPAFVTGWLAVSGPARADDDPTVEIVVVPAACAPYWSAAARDESPAAWDALVSFASCIQDRRVGHVADADRIGELVDELRGALAPALELYATAIEDGPPDVKLRAAYHVGLAQVAMMTRARASLASSELRPHLEPLLDVHAELAYYIFTTIHRAATDDPALTPDGVTRYMARSAGEMAAALRRRWTTPPGDDAPRLAFSPR